jgi:hypothetical protein
LKRLRENLSFASVRADNYKKLAEQYGERMQEQDEEFARSPQAIDSNEIAMRKTEEHRFGQLRDVIQTLCKPDEYFEIKSGMEIRFNDSRVIGVPNAYRKVFFRGSTPDQMWDWKNSGWVPETDKSEREPLLWDNFYRFKSDKGLTMMQYIIAPPAQNDNKLEYGGTDREVLVGENTIRNVAMLYDGAHCFLIRNGTNVEKEKAGAIIAELQKRGRGVANIHSRISSLMMINGCREHDEEKLAAINGVLYDAVEYGVVDREEDDKLDRLMQRRNYAIGNNERFAMIMTDRQYS